MPRTYNGSWSPEEEQYLRDNLAKMPAAEIAAKLGRSTRSIYSRSYLLKISGKGTWTDQDIEYLEERYGRISNKLIAKNLGRSVGAIEKKAQRLFLGRKDAANGMITIAVLYRALHGGAAPGKRDKERLKRHGLKTYSYKLYSGKRKIVELVNLDEFWKWAEANQKFVKLAKLEENALGIEPGWAKKKRKKEWLENSNKRWHGKG